MVFALPLHRCCTENAFSHRHPCEGQAHVIEDVGIRLVNGLHDLHLDEKLGPTQEAISKGIATGSEGVWKLYSSVKSDLAKRQAEYRERREREEASKPAAQAGDAEVKEAENERPQLISDQGEETCAVCLSPS